MHKNTDNTNPFIVIIGTSSSFSSAVGICNKKVITRDIGQFVFSCILTLMAIFYSYELLYHPSTHEVLEFLQEKILGDCPKKVSCNLSNLVRAVTCIEQKMDEEFENMDNEIESDDETQLASDF